MEPEKLILEKEGRDAMAILARLRDPDAALLYAFAASRPQGCTQAEAAAALDWDEGRTDRAAQLLLVYGLAARRHLPPPREETSFLPQELSAARERDPAFAGLCSYFERAQGRILNRRELETLLSVHESLGLPPEVMALVIGECARRGRLSARSVEKLAYQWYDLGLDQYEKAEEYLRRQAVREDRYARVLTRFGIRDHAPSPGERDYLDRWFALGFSDEMLALAYDRTILGAHRFSWAYMNKILLDWSEKKLRTPEDVQNARRAPVSRPGAALWSWNAAGRPSAGPARSSSRPSGPSVSWPAAWPGPRGRPAPPWRRNTAPPWLGRAPSFPSWGSPPTGSPTSPTAPSAGTGATSAPRSAAVSPPPSVPRKNPPPGCKHPGKIAKKPRKAPPFGGAF